MTFEKYSEKHNKLLGLLKQLREIEEQSYVLIDCRNDVQTDLILSRNGFNPENKEAASFGKKIEKIENMMDNLDKERREIYGELNKLRTSTSLDYSHVNRKLLDLTGGNFDDNTPVRICPNQTCVKVQTIYNISPNLATSDWCPELCINNLPDLYCQNVKNTTDLHVD